MKLEDEEFRETVNVTINNIEPETLKRLAFAIDMQLALCKVQNYLRSITKYAPDDLPDNVIQDREKIREEINDIIYEAVPCLENL